MKSLGKLILKVLILLLISLIFLAFVPMYIILFPVHLVNKKITLYLSTYLTYSIWSLTGLIFKLSSKIESGTVLDKKNYLIVSNHLGSIDFMLINEVAERSGMISHLKYAVKDGLKYFPIFYQGLLFTGFLVLKRSFEIDKDKIVSYFNYFKNNNIPIWFVLYPEGSRFTEKLKLRSWEYSEKKDYPKFNHVLFPRYKGFKLICEQLNGSGIEYIADITFGYSKKDVPPLWKIFFGSPGGVFKYDIKITPIAEIDDYEKFIYDSFARKDKILEKWATQNDLK